MKTLESGRERIGFSAPFSSDNNSYTPFQKGYMTTRRINRYAMPRILRFHPQPIIGKPIYRSSGWPSLIS